MSTDTTPELSPEQLAEIERKFDPETAFRPTGKMIGFLIAAILVSMSVYHFYASGFGLVRELVHRGIHLSFVLGLVFLLFGIRKSETLGQKAWHRFDGVPLIDMFLHCWQLVLQCTSRFCPQRLWRNASAIHPHQMCSWALLCYC